LFSKAAAWRAAP